MEAAVHLDVTLYRVMIEMPNLRQIPGPLSAQQREYSTTSCAR